VCHPRVRLAAFLAGEFRLFLVIERREYLRDADGYDHRDNTSTIPSGERREAHRIAAEVGLFGPSLNLMPHQSGFAYRGIDKTPGTGIIDGRGAAEGQAGGIPRLPTRARAYVK